MTAEADPSLLAPGTQAEARLAKQLQQRLRTQGYCPHPALLTTGLSSEVIEVPYKPYCLVPSIALHSSTPKQVYF